MVTHLILVKHSMLGQVIMQVTTCEREREEGEGRRGEGGGREEREGREGGGRRESGRRRGRKEGDEREKEGWRGTYLTSPFTYYLPHHMGSLTPLPYLNPSLI